MFSRSILPNSKIVNFFTEISDQRERTHVNRAVARIWLAALPSRGNYVSIKYRQLHTGPKIQSGGFQVGLARSAYQLGILGAVTRPPRPAAAKQMMIVTTRPTHC